MPRDISNSDDVIDSRDVIARIDALQDERTDLEQAITDAQEALDEAAGQDRESYSDTQDRDNYTSDPLQDAQEAVLQTALDDATAALAAWDADNLEELKALLSFADEAEGCAEDWQYGATLVRDSYFTDYAQELCEDIGDVPKDLPHYIEIDWNATARNVQADYTSVEFDGVTYWVR